MAENVIDKILTKAANKSVPDVIPSGTSKYDRSAFMIETGLTDDQKKEVDRVNGSGDIKTSVKIYDKIP